MDLLLFLSMGFSSALFGASIVIYAQKRAINAYLKAVEHMLNNDIIGINFKLNELELKLKNVRNYSQNL